MTNNDEALLAKQYVDMFNVVIKAKPNHHIRWKINDTTCVVISGGRFKITASGGVLIVENGADTWLIRAIHIDTITSQAITATT
jgi:hypothetical protein